MSRRLETRGFKGGFISTELKSTDPKGQNTESATQWQGSSDREESLSDPRWHRRPPTKGKKANTSSPKRSPHENTIQIHDAREVIAQKKAEEFRKKSNLPKIIFNDNQAMQPSRTEHKKITNYPETRSCQTENDTNSTATQTMFSGEQQKSDDEIWVSRVDPTKIIQKEKRHNEAPPTMTETTSLEASQKLVTEGLVATLDKHGGSRRRNAPLQEKTPTGTGSTLYSPGHQKDRNLRPLINFVKKKDWEAIKTSDREESLSDPRWHRRNSLPKSCCQHNSRHSY